MVSEGLPQDDALSEMFRLSRKAFSLKGPLNPWKVSGEWSMFWQCQTMPPCLASVL
jgi:hypothetical protein